MICCILFINAVDLLRWRYDNDGSKESSKQLGHEEVVCTWIRHGFDNIVRGAFLRCAKLASNLGLIHPRRVFPFFSSRPGMYSFAPGQEVPSVNAGEMVDVSDVPAASPAKAAGVPVGRSGGVLVRSDGRGGDTTLDITAAVEAFGIGGRRDSSHASCPGNADAANGKRDVSGGDGESVRDEPRRVRFVDESGLDSDGGRDKNQERESDLMQEENQVEGGDEEEGEAEEAGREGGRAEVARIMSERFLAGKVPGVNYKDVDEDERLDDLEQIASDEVGRVRHSDIS